LVRTNGCFSGVFAAISADQSDSWDLAETFEDIGMLKEKGAA
jgi:hypothetical protein